MMFKCSNRNHRSIMAEISFQRLPLVVNLFVFALAAGGVWIAGGRIAIYAKVISSKTRLGQAFVGTLLLGAIASLPEMAMSISAALLGNAKLAVNTLLGGITMSMIVLAITDMVSGPEPLSLDISRPGFFLEGALLVLFLVVGVCGVTMGDIPLGHVGVWTLSLLVLYIFFVALVKWYGERQSWVPKDNSSRNPSLNQSRSKRFIEDTHSQRSLTVILFLTAVASLVILIAGFVLASSVDSIAEQTGLGASFVGWFLGGLVTSLPEMSTAVSAVRLKQFEMAFSDILGTNLFSVMLLFFADLAYKGGPILNEVGRFSLLAMLLGIAVTVIYIAGVAERWHKTIFRMGVDSFAVILVSLGGMLLLYFVR